MNRRNFLKTAAIGTVGMMLPGYVHALSDTPNSDNPYPHFDGDMYDLRNETVPFDIYICGEDVCSKNHPHQNVLEFYNGPLMDDLARELDYKSKGKEEYIVSWLDNANEYYSYLSNGKFQLALRKIEKLEGNDGDRKLNNMMKEENLQKDRAFRMIVTTDIDYSNEFMYPHLLGKYVHHGLHYVQPFSLQKDRDGEKTFSVTPIHEVFHGLGFPEDFLHTTKKSVMNMSSRHNMAGLSKREFKHMGWPVVEPIDVNSIGYTFDKGKVDVWKD